MAAGRDAGRRHDLLGERLGALEPRGGRDRAEAADALGRQRVGEARDERRLRTDDDEVDPASRAARASAAGSSAGASSTRASRRMPAFPGRAQHLGRLRRAQERPDERVLAPARADDENPHTAPMKSSIGIADIDS